jgi:hypothetical protein
MFRNTPHAIVDQSAINPIEALMASMERFPDPASYSDDVRHSLECWPKGLRDLSFPSVGFELSPNEIVLLAGLWGEVDLGLEDYPTADAAWANAADVIAKSNVPTSDGPPKPLLEFDILVGLMNKIDTVIADLSSHGIEGPIFKLGTRSPKESPFITCSSGRVYSSAQVLLLLFTSSRVLSDIASDQCYNEWHIAKDGELHPELVENLKTVPVHRTWFWFRQFEPFEPYQEFRLVIRNRTFVGGTQYHNITSDPRGRFFEALPFPELVEHGYAYEKLIMEWLPSFYAVNPYDDAVVDVIVNRHTGKVILLETNPCGKRTFPGLLDWDNEATFNGEVQWVAEPIRFSAPKISQSHIQKIREKCVAVPAPPAYEAIAQKSPPSPAVEKARTMLEKLFGKKKG